MPVDATAPDLRAELGRQWTEELQALFDRMAERWDDNPDDWAIRLTDQIGFLGKRTAVAFGRFVVDRFVQTNSARYEQRFRTEMMDGWIAEVATNSGTNIVGQLSERIEDEGQDEAFSWVTGAGVALFAGSLLGTFANFGAHEGARSAGGRQKTWQVNSQNPRASHAAMSGETVDLGDVFSNGLRWPGYPGDASEVANCQCSLVFP